MLGTIVIPHDGSEAMTPALQYAELVPSRAVRLVRVEPPFQVLAPGPLENFRPDWRTVRTEQIQQEMVQLVERFQRQGRTVEIAVRFGDPAEEIVAAGDDADAIIMSTQGRGTAGRALFGSVADRVSRHAHTPTLLVRAAAEPFTPRIERIVVPLDGSPLAEQALPMAATLATELEKPVHLIRVARPGQAPEDGVAVATAYLEGIANQLRARGLNVQPGVQVGRAIFALLDELRPDDLVVMTPHGRSGMERWLLGSVAEQLIRNAPGPVLLVRDAASAPPQSQ